jgi:hypothetical protein
MGWDGKGREGMGRDGMGWEGKGWGGKLWCHYFSIDLAVTIDLSLTLFLPETTPSL